MAVSGTPTLAGTYAYSVKVTDSTTPTAQSTSQAYSGTIQPTALTFGCSPSSGPTAVGVAYSASCTVSGGTAPYNWSIVSGSLPAGLSLQWSSVLISFAQGIGVLWALRRRSRKR